LANTVSAEKRNRQAQKRRVRNMKVRTGVKSAVKKAREAIVRGDASAREAFQAAAKTLEKAASKGVVHKNAASRRISRLAKALAKGSSGAQAKA
jgi:small subunit ribosomal protein S20